MEEEEEVVVEEEDAEALEAALQLSLGIVAASQGSGLGAAAADTQEVTQSLNMHRKCTRTLALLAAKTR